MSLPKIISKIEDKFSDYTLDTTKFVGENIIHIKGSSNINILNYLKIMGLIS